MEAYTDKIKERFWSKVDRRGDCWLWMGPTYKCGGYGKFGIGGKNKGAHRISLELHLGRPIRDNLVVAHKPIVCHNPACVNPDHLREATHSENALDKRLDGTVVPMLTEEQVCAIRTDMRTQSVIAEEYGISVGLIYKIKTLKAYAWVP